MKITGLRAGYVLFLTLTLIFISTASHAQTSAIPTIAAEQVRIIPMHDPRQPFDMAAKLQWNPQSNQWDRVLVMYNDSPQPPAEHPVWRYLASLSDPGRGPRTAGENLDYKSFRINAYCEGQTPLSTGQAMRISFDQHPTGPYQERAHLSDWNCPAWSMGRERTLIVDGQQARKPNGKSLRLTIDRGMAGCDGADNCINWKPHLGTEADSLYYSYWIKFPEHFDDVLGGKLPGIGSKEASSGGGKPNGRDGWSVRAMWDQNGHLGQYVYHVDQPKHFGEFIPWVGSTPEKGKWHHIKTYVRLNDAGQRNGMIRTWLNGQIVLDKRDMRFRLSNDLKIERFLFAVFFGGSGSQWAPSRPMQVYFDDFVISHQDH